MSVLVFYAYSIALVAWAAGVVFSRNPVHSVLCLIMSFITTAGIFVLISAEYLAFLLVVVYVGAVAVLFLFVVMMLDVDFAGLRRGFVRSLPLALVVVTALIVQLGLMAVAIVSGRGERMGVESGGVTENAEQLGIELYTTYIYAFQLAGLALLVAMVGAIMLTFRARSGVRSQDPADQVARSRSSGVSVVSVARGKGVT